MPVIATVIVGALLSIVETMIGRILAALGVGFATFSGVSVLLASIKTQLLNNLHSLPLEAVQILGLLKFGVAVSILFSAVTIKLTLAGMTKSGDMLKSFMRGK